MLCLVRLIRLGQAIWVLHKTEWLWEFPLAYGEPTIVVRITLITSGFIHAIMKVTKKGPCACLFQLGHWQSACRAQKGHSHGSCKFSCMLHLAHI